VFNKVKHSGELENVYVAYNFIHFAVYVPKRIKIGRHLMKL